MTVKTALTTLEQEALLVIQRAPVEAARLLAALWEECGGGQGRSNQVEQERRLRVLLDELRYPVFHWDFRGGRKEGVCPICGGEVKPDGTRHKPQEQGVGG